MPAKVNRSRLMEAYSRTLCTLVGSKADESQNQIIVDDAMKMNVRWKSGSQVDRARELTSMCETN